MSLPESFERAATELTALADKIRPANGDAHRLLDELSADEAGTLLAWMLDQATEDAAEFVEEWGESDAGVALLLGVSDAGIGKSGRKLLRKARHRLRSQGIAVETEAALVNPTNPMKKKSVTSNADKWQAAHVSSPDFRGARMGYLVDSHPSGGARLFEIRFDEGRGLLDFKIYNAGRSKIRGFLKSLTENSGRRLFEVDRDALRALIWRASQAQPTDRPLPTSYVEWRSRLFSDELEKVETPGEQIRKALGEGDVPSALAALAGEVKAGKLGPWPPQTSWVGDWMDKGRDAVDGLEDERRGAAIDTWIADVTNALDADSDQALIARHLDELAWVKSQEGDEDGARALLAVSGALGSDASASKAFTRARVESLFEPFLASLRVIEETLDDLSPESGS